MNHTILHPPDEAAFLREHPIAGAVVLPGSLAAHEMVPVLAAEGIWWVIPCDTPASIIRDISASLAGASTFATVDRARFLELERDYHRNKPRPSALKSSPSRLSPQREAKRLLLERAEKRASLRFWLALLLLGSVLAGIAYSFRWSFFDLHLATWLPLLFALRYLYLRHIGRRLCQEQDFLCPHCSEGLFVHPNGHTHWLRDGICPHCKADIDPIAAGTAPVA